ncbi:MAG: hypothetical protein AAF387_10165, partial [Pseudomonadota bacterium]
MSKFELRFAAFVLQFRWPIIVCALLSIANAGYGAKDLYLSSSYRVMFGEDNPQLVAFDEIENKYAKNDNVMIVIAPNDRNVFSRETLSVVAKVTEQAWQAPYSSRVDSITNYQHTEAEEDDLVVADLVADPASLTDSELQKIKNIAVSEPLLANRLIALDGNSTAVNINLQIPTEIESEGTVEAAKFARELAQKVMAEHPDIKIYLTGVIMMNN